jgi:hypothetical protein
LLAHLEGGGLLLLLLAKLKLSCSGASTIADDSVVRAPLLVLNAKGISSYKKRCGATQSGSR